MPSSKKSLVKILIANACCRCWRPKPSHVHQPTPLPIPKPTISPNNPSSSSILVNTVENTSTALDQIGDVKASKIITASIAVVKDSKDPYQDFRHSMLQMIFEREIYSRDELHQLLNCFLELNSPSHHPIIIQVFTHIWNDIISKHQLTPTT